MMKRRRVLWVTLGLLALLAAAGPLAYYLRAKLAGEHFFRGRPTSYWAYQIRQWKDQPVWTVPWPDRVLNVLGVKGSNDRPTIFDGGPAAIPVVLDLVTNEDPGMRDTACIMLTSSSVVPDDLAAATLVKAVQIRRSDVRLSVLTYLPNGPEAVPALIQALDDDSYFIRQVAIEMLAGLASEAQEARPALRTCLLDSSWQVREAAEDALKRIESAGRTTVEESVDWLLRQNRREYFRPYVFYWYVEQNEWELPLPSGKGPVKRLALEAQTKSIVTLGKKAVGQLLRWVDAPEWHVRYIAIRALSDLTGLSPLDPLSKDSQERQRALKVWQKWYEEHRPPDAGSPERG
jgi:hypothetical protein